MNFSEFLASEEWKPFPKDKVNRSISKKKEKGGREDSYKAHKQQAVANFKNKMTDPSKAGQKFTGSDREKTQNQIEKHNDDAEKKYGKAFGYFDKKKNKNNQVKGKEAKKFVKKRDKGDTAAGRRDGMAAVKQSYNRTTHEDDKKQAEHNKKDKESRQKAKGMMNRAGLEKAFKKKSAKDMSKMNLGKMKETMNFTDWQNSLMDPLYEVKGMKTVCPEGTKYDAKTNTCVPVTQKSSENPNQKEIHPAVGGYHVWGATGLNGDGYALEDSE